MVWLIAINGGCVSGLIAAVTMLLEERAKNRVLVAENERLVAELSARTVLESTVTNLLQCHED